MITLYSTGCPKCRVIETKLEQKGIEYQVDNNIDILVEKGFISVPVLDVDGEFMDFTKANKWINEQKGGASS